MGFHGSCDEKGLIASKQIGFILEGILKNEMFDLIKAGWEIVEVRKLEERKDVNALEGEHGG